jgi:NitT/TauT family transport system substrate-binding protein
MKFFSLSSIVLLLVSLLLTVSCNPLSSPTPTTEKSSAPIVTSVRLGFSAWPGWIPWQVAQAEKLFQTNQVNVDLVWYDGYLDSIKALANNQLEANSQTLNDTISSLAGGADQVIVLVNDNSTGNDQIIARKEITTVADLKGRKVAAEPGTVDHFLLLLGLRKAGLTQADINFQPMETGAAAAAFVAGKVDAVGVFAPFTTQALKLPGSRALFTSKDFPGAIPDHLVVSRQLIKTHPEQVQALVNTWFDTLDYIRKHREEAYSIMAKRANVTVKEYQDYDAGTRIFTLADNLQAFSSGNNNTSLTFAAQEISKFLVESKLIKQAPDLSNLLDDRFVKAYASAHSK